MGSAGKEGKGKGLRLRKKGSTVWEPAGMGKGGGGTCPTPGNVEKFFFAANVV